MFFRGGRSEARPSNEPYVKNRITSNRIERIELADCAAFLAGNEWILLFGVNPLRLAAQSGQSLAADADEPAVDADLE